MTSEVLILKKKAVVIGADSAVTSSSGAGPLRYAKSGHKIFELAKCGSVAVAVYGSANIDGTREMAQLAECLIDFLQNPKASFEDERLAFIEAARAHAAQPRQSPLAQWIRHKFENGPPPEKTWAPWADVSCWRASPGSGLTD